MKNTISKFVWLGLCGSAMQLAASSPVIGVARSWGAFYVNNASVPGSATVFDGTSVKTADASSNLNLNGGERVTLASNSAATVHPDRLSLDRGTAEISGAADYRVEARNVRVQASDAAARIRVGIDRQNRVLVASLGGAAEVRNSQGRLVARLASGEALTLSAASPEAVDMTGVVSEHEGKFYLTDNVTKVKVELHGKGLSKLVGKMAHIIGTLGSPEGAAIAGAAEVVIVESATLAAAAAGAGAGAAAAGAGATIAGISTTTVAIAGGAVAVGGTVGGLAAAGTIGGSSTVSR